MQSKLESIKLHNKKKDLVIYTDNNDAKNLRRKREIKPWGEELRRGVHRLAGEAYFERCGGVFSGQRRRDAGET